MLQPLGPTLFFPGSCEKEVQVSETMFKKSIIIGKTLIFLRKKNIIRGKRRKSRSLRKTAAKFRKSAMPRKKLKGRKIPEKTGTMSVNGAYYSLVPLYSA